MSEAKGKVPAWLSDLGVKEGEYFTDSKARWKRAMKARCFCPAARVYACLGLHTMAFRQQLAVKMEAGKRVHLTPQDVAAETGIAKQKIRGLMLELHEWGLAEIKGSTKGRVELYAWAVPREVEHGQNGNRAGYHFEGAPKSLQRLLSRFRIDLPPDFVISAGYLSGVNDALAGYENARMVLRAALNGNPNAERPNKEERNERKEQQQQPVVVAPTPAAQLREDLVKFDPLVTEETAAAIIRECYAAAGEAVPVSVIREVIQLMKFGQGTRNPMGLLRKTLPSACRTYKADQQAARAAPDNEAERKYHERRLRTIREVWNSLSEEEREYYREIYPQLAGAGVANG